MSQIVEGWKSCTSRHAGKLLGRLGQFWAEDYWDTFMRDALPCVAAELPNARNIEHPTSNIQHRTARIRWTLE